MRNAVFFLAVLTDPLLAAKRAFKLTDAELLTLAHEQIAASPKSYYALKDVKALARRKYEAGALLEDLSENPDVIGSAGVRKKYQDNGRRNKGNWDDAPSFEVPGSRMALYMAANKAKRDKE